MLISDVRETLTIVRLHGPKLLVHPQKGQQCDIRMLVPLDDADPILIIVLVIIESVQHEY